MRNSTFTSLPESKRSRVLQAALAEFAGHSYREASLDRIASASGVSKGSLYQYFENKRDLYEHLVLDELGRRKLAAIGAALEASGAAEASFVDRLARTLTTGLEFFRSDPLAATLASRLLADQSDPDVASLHVRAHEAGVAHMRAELARALARGELRDDVDLELASHLLAQLTGRGLVDALVARLGGSIERLARTKKSAIDDELVRSMVEQLVAFVAHGVSAPTASPRPKGAS
jgi:AcrR family transcriptional regulator